MKKISFSRTAGVVRPRSFPFFYGWIIVAGATLGMLASIPGQTLGVSVFTDYLIQHLSLTRAQLSLAYLFGTVTSSIILPFTGRLFDRYGSRILMLVSSVSLGIVLVILSQCDRIAHALNMFFSDGRNSFFFSFMTITIGFLCIRFWGQGMITMSSRIMMSKWFDRKRGFASGINNVAVSFFFAVAPLPMDWLVQSLTWRGAWIVMGFGVGAVVSVIAWIFFRDNPEECGLTMDGESDAGSHNASHREKTHQFCRSEALRTPAFWIYNLVFAMHGLLLTAITFHIVSIGAVMGLTRIESLRFFLPMSIVSVIITLLSGPLMDRFRLQPFFYGHIIALIGGTLGVMQMDIWWGKILMVGGLGIAGGLWANLMMVVWPRFYGWEHLGSISSINMSFMVAGSALGPYMFGFAYDHWGSYRWGIIASLIPLLFLGCIAFFAKNPQEKNIKI